MSTAVAAPEETAAEATPAKSVGKRKLILIVAPILLVLLIGAGLWFSGLLPHRTRAPNPSKVATIVEKPSLVEVPDIVTNLDNGPHRAVFVRLKARIEVAHAADQAVITANMPRILDAFQTYLRSLRPEELHGGEGSYRLREALMNRIDIIVGPVKVLDVLFVEMLVQ